MGRQQWRQLCETPQTLLYLRMWIVGLLRPLDLQGLVAPVDAKHHDPMQELSALCLKANEPPCISRVMQGQTVTAVSDLLSCQAHDARILLDQNSASVASQAPASASGKV